MTITIHITLIYVVTHTIIFWVFLTRSRHARAHHNARTHVRAEILVKKTVRGSFHNSVPEGRLRWFWLARWLLTLVDSSEQQAYSCASRQGPTSVHV